MKKIITMLMVVMFSFTSVSCGKITYTKEFSYLPSQKEMTLKSFVKPTKDAMGTATYTIKSKKSKEVLDAYEKQLKNDKWNITKDKRPASIAAEKAGHKVVIVPTQIKDDVQLTVMSK